MEYQYITVENQGAIAVVTFNRPKVMNSLCINMLLEIGDAFTRIEQDDEIRVAVLTATGPAFCAGADLKELIADIDAGPKPGPSFFKAAGVGFGALDNLTKPLVVALNGITCAGGLEMAMKGDVIYAADNAQIGDCHSNYGVFPGGGGAVTLSRKIPQNKANYLLMTGEFASAQEMKDWGLLQDVVPVDQLMDVAMEAANKIALKSPLVMAHMKQIVKDGAEMPLEAALRAEKTILSAHIRSYDFSEGLTAFGEKRQPEFRGY